MFSNRMPLLKKFRRLATIVRAVTRIRAEVCEAVSPLIDIFRCVYDKIFYRFVVL